jgi:hypothetical protein
MPDMTATDTARDWTDLADNAPGIGITHEAARRREAEGAGADRSWRVGADGEFLVADVLAHLTAHPRFGGLGLRRPRWRVLHSVPLPGGRDVDHVMIGPPGVVTINSKHHRRGRLVVDGDRITVNGIATDYVERSRREAQYATAVLATALRAHGSPALAELLPVRPLIAVLGGLLHVERWPYDVVVVTTMGLNHVLQSLPSVLGPGDVDAVYEMARRSTTWTTEVKLA